MLEKLKKENVNLRLEGEVELTVLLNKRSFENGRVIYYIGLHNDDFGSQLLAERKNKEEAKRIYKKCIKQLKEGKYSFSPDIHVEDLFT